MKTVLCYGDSITWGFNPADETRFAFDVRWPGVVLNTLGVTYRVIEEGLSGRTVVRASDVDGVHLDADGHGKLGAAIAEIISSADRAVTPV